MYLMRKRVYKYIFFIIILTSLNCYSHPCKQLKITLVFYDKGETFALLPVSRELERLGHEVRFLLLGPSRFIESVSTDSRALDSRLYCKIKEEISPNAGWKPSNEISYESIEKVFNSLECDILISGMASKAQQQILQRFARDGIKTFAFYDAFTPIKATDIASSFFEIKTEFLVSSPKLAQKISEEAPESKVYAVGQPSLEKWTEFFTSTVKEEVLNELGIDRTKPVVLFLGGCGDNYAEVFDLFAQIAEDKKDVNILVSLHPKELGLIEKEILIQYDCEHVKLIKAGSYMDRIIACSTERAATITDVFINWHSDTGMHATCIGRPVLYLDVEHTDYSDIPLELGAIRVFEKDSAILALDFLLEGGMSPPHGTNDVPSNSIKRIAQLVLEKIKV